jgi:hypothetical protein
MTSHDLESVALTPARIAGQAPRGEAGVISAVTPYRISGRAVDCISPIRSRCRTPTARTLRAHRRRGYQVAMAI